MQAPNLNIDVTRLGWRSPALHITLSVMGIREAVKIGLFIKNSTDSGFLVKVRSVAIKAFLVIGGGAAFFGVLRGYYGPQIINPIVVQGLEFAAKGLQVGSVLYCLNLLNNNRNNFV
ncbi:MAG: hypothetical protein SP4CHLAM5_01620 [Chlamydiia bacterium]|nr:hypothetical protein [Chlamydiia bacterium]MCH9618036.1 hypothetical protein [Chlamydiia bacterium]MCH9623639.1 hypothetical protein [Chlamydiia bacterium]